MNIREVLRELGIKTHDHKATPGWVTVIDCPYCGKPGKPGMGVSADGRIANCWKCGAHSLVKVLAEITGLSFRDILRILPTEADSSSLEAKSPHGGRYLPPEGTGPLLGPHRAYLAKRGFDPDELVERYGIQGIGDVPGGFRWRVLLPVRSDSKPCAWTTRAIGSKATPRYLSSTDTTGSCSLKALLFAEEHCRHAVVVTEGPFQAMRIGPGAAAIMGVSYTREQVVRIAKYPVRVICFDNEPGAQRRARKLADSLSVFPGETHVAVCSGPQPDSSPPEEIEDLRRRFLG